MNTYIKLALIGGAVVTAKVVEHLYLRKVIKDAQAKTVEQFKNNPELFKRMAEGKE